MIHGQYTIAIEEHYWDKALSETYSRGTAVVREQTGLMKRLFQYGEERIKEMDRAGIDVQVLSPNRP
jgi:hypothetical protein